MKKIDDLFTVDYAVNYDGWEFSTIDDLLYWYDRGTDQIALRPNDFPLLLYIYDEDSTIITTTYVKTIKDYKKLKKELGWR